MPTQKYKFAWKSDDLRKVHIYNHVLSATTTLCTLCGELIRPDQWLVTSDISARDTVCGMCLQVRYEEENRKIIDPQLEALLDEEDNDLQLRRSARRRNRTQLIDEFDSWVHTRLIHGPRMASDQAEDSTISGIQMLLRAMDLLKSEGEDPD